MFLPIGGSAFSVYDEAGFGRHSTLCSGSLVVI